MVKVWTAAFAVLALGVLAHDLVAELLVQERIAGVLLAAGAGARPADALLALVFVGARVFGFPLVLAVAAVSVVSALAEVVSRRNQRRSTTRGSRGRAQR